MLPRDEKKKEVQKLGEEDKLNARIALSSDKVFRCGWMYKEGEALDASAVACVGLTSLFRQCGS